MSHVCVLGSCFCLHVVRNEVSSGPLTMNQGSAQRPSLEPDVDHIFRVKKVKNLLS
jgi:hypothetical protein